MEVPGFEPGAFRMQSECDTTTPHPQAYLPIAFLPSSNEMDRLIIEQLYKAYNCIMLYISQGKVSKQNVAERKFISITILKTNQYINSYFTFNYIAFKTI